LTPDEELAALVAFMTASNTHALPLDINTTVPLDAGYILGFNSASMSKERFRREIDALVKETWQNYPVVLLTKVRKVALSRSYLI
jgi:hypothetical protein